MDKQSDKCETTFHSGPSGRGRATWWGWCVWLPGCAAFAALIAWAAFEIAHAFAPLFVFPVLLGALLGASLVTLARMFQMGHRATAWAAVVICTGVILVGRHYFSYREASAEAEQGFKTARNTQAAFAELFQGEMPGRPASLLDYLRQQARAGRQISTLFGSWSVKETEAWLLWGLDGILVLLPAVVMVGFALRRPFCQQCGSWYSTRRVGRLDAASVERLAAEIDLPLKNAVGGASYRLICCDQGCAPSGFSLSFEESSGSKKEAVFWLDDRRRALAVEILDKARPTTGKPSLTT